MVGVTAVYGLLLVVLGLAGYILTDRASITALIPTFFGVPVLLCAVLARNEKLYKHVMHAAVLLALVGLLGSFTGIPDLISMLMGGEVERPAAAISRSLMALLSAAFIALGVRSFIAFRREAAGGDAAG